MIYLLVLKWRSAINVSSMRYFPDYKALKAHVGGKYDAKWAGYHAYKVFPDQEAQHLPIKELRDLGLWPPKE